MVARTAEMMAGQKVKMRATKLAAKKVVKSVDSLVEKTAR